jgi:hypothetical protein
MVPKSKPSKFRHVLDHKVAQSDNVSVADRISALDQARTDPRDTKYATIITLSASLNSKRFNRGDKNEVATQQHTAQYHLHPHWGKNAMVFVDDMTIYDEKPRMSMVSLLTLPDMSGDSTFSAQTQVLQPEENSFLST